MSAVLRALSYLREQGVSLSLDGDDVVLTNAENLSEADIVQLRELKPAIVAELRRTSAPEDQVGALVDLWRKRHGRDIPVHNVAPTQPTPLTPERLAKVAATLSAPTPPDVAAHVAARMGVSQESLPREEWWNKPVEGWPRELPITSALTGETVTVKLEDDEA